MIQFPNWRDADAYPTETSFMEPERLIGDHLYTSKAWAWQFLRRNKSYQTDYLRFRQSGDHSLGKDIARKYGMTMMLPFGEEAPDLIPFSSTLALHQLDLYSINRKLPNLGEFHLALIFDLTLPIPDQIRLAKAQIEEEISRRKPNILPTKRKRKPEFIRYLRIIDAKQHGETNKAIARQFIADRVYRVKYRNGDKLYACQSLIETDVRVAHQILEEGYRAIAYS